ncbi:hypothetical protein RHGRI_021988 [Rhododendron griersonianum]|uniref:Uncharacterized protein n=1 Tax=Rhododendron griersonianum TaxID=479676 RepID=A0AAV6JSA3_9ERIC|nr:hypothetical protein RHGRI_021988 [Rhododendron griersonianum]
MDQCLGKPHFSPLSPSTHASSMVSGWSGGGRKRASTGPVMVAADGGGSVLEKTNLGGKESSMRVSFHRYAADAVNGTYSSFCTYNFAL